MSYSIIKQNDDITYNLVELVADTPADLVSLPTTFAAGSTVLIISTSETYILNNNKEWQLKESGGDGGYIPKVEGATAGNVPTLKEDGTLEDSGDTIPTKTSDLINDSNFVTDEDIVNKVDKVSGAIVGDVATLDSTGNLVDSGVAISSGLTVPSLRQIYAGTATMSEGDTLAAGVIYLQYSDD